jgi:hypothetical protein
MRLDGSLEDFTLPDILQLLTRTKKTGSLQLLAIGDDRRGLVRLASGAVNGASSDLRRHALARRLVGSGLVSDEALTAAAADVRAGAPSLVRALLEHGDVDSAEVSRLAADQVTDAVCELLRWSTGSFSFLVGDPDPEGLDLELSAEELVAEGERRMQVWPSLTTHIPSSDTVLRLAASPAFDPSCSREEWGLIALVDGNRTVHEIVALLGRSEFAVAGALSALVERGLLTVSTPGAGLGDLQRRQDVIAALEGSAPVPVVQAEQRPIPQPVTVSEPEPVPAPAAVEVESYNELASFAAHEPPVLEAAHEVPAYDAPVHASSSEVPAFEVPAFEVPAFEVPAFEVPLARSEAVEFAEPMTDGSAALAPAHAESSSPEGSTRGLDSAVTKSLVLRLIAGVRGL